MTKMGSLEREEYGLGMRDKYEESGVGMIILHTSSSFFVLCLEIDDHLFA